ncbi:hypothetical protein [Nostoc sp.]|uniref:hypothetical protein n=1 Tax=Nostoc sp. TaxID=1180 RepID=UPI002FF95309
MLLPQTVNQLHVSVGWGDYQPLTKPDSEGKEITFTGDWQRVPREAELTVPLRTSGRPTQLDLGLNLGNKLNHI